MVDIAGGGAEASGGGRARGASGAGAGGGGDTLHPMLTQFAPHFGVYIEHDRAGQYREAVRVLSSY